MTRQVPEIDLADYTDGAEPARARFAADLFAGLQRFGFVILRGHPIDTDLLDQAYRLSAELFAEPEEFKRRHLGHLRGYTPFGTETAKDYSVADLKEFWQVGAERQQATDVTEHGNVWPSRPAGWREVCETLYAGLEHTGRIVLEALTPGLELPGDYFAAMLEDNNSVLRILHYPPVPDDAPPGSIRAAPHEDINLLTLLVAAEGPGLELLDRDGRWLPVTTDRHNLIIDSGDMLARITNDVLPATTHRVVNPEGANVSRYSMPFFMHPNSSTLLRCLPSCIGSGPKYPDITAGEFLAQRLREIGLLDRDT